MQYHWLVPLAAAVANLLICALVLRGGLRSRQQRTFIAMTLALVCWNLDIYALEYFPDAEAAEWWSRVFRTGLCFVPAAVFDCTLALAEMSGGVAGILVGGGYAVGAWLAVVNLRGHLVQGIRHHTWGWYIEPAPLYAVFTSLLVLCVAFAFERVWHAYRRPSSPHQRTQAKFWFLAVAVQTPFAFANVLAVYGVPIYPIGNLGNVFWVAIIAYAIARHRLMDVDYVVRKGMSFALAAAVVLVPGGIGLVVLGRVLQVEGAAVFVCAALGLAMLSAIFIPTLREALETRLHRAFFPQLYDGRRRLQELAASLVHVLDRGELVQRLGDTLGAVFDVEACEVFVRDDHTRRLLRAHPETTAPEALADDCSAAFEHVSGPILAEELDPGHAAAATTFRARGWEVAIPLRVKDRLTGLVVLGRKRSFRIFSGEDLSLLATVAAGASVALENANLSRRLRHSETALERATRLSSIGMLAAGIAHEIRNPLVAVKTFLDLLPERLHDEDFMASFRDLSLSELRRVTDLIADLLALGKSKSAERCAVDLVPTLEPVIRLMESSARKRRVELEVVSRPHLARVLADPDQLKQFTLNLLLNAIEMSPPESRVTLELRPTGPHRAAGVVLEVRDHGPGITAEQLEHIFDPFFTTKEAGTGLGLALVHQIVLEHGGDITVDSQVGQGSIFRVTLPALHAALAPTGT